MNNNSEKNKLKSDELDQFVLDRLVDNDLSQEEYREVLRLVETKPDGWQKLALAFLESQALEVELSALHLDAELSELELGGTDGSSRLPSSQDVDSLAFDPKSQSERILAESDVPESQNSRPQNIAKPIRSSGSNSVQRNKEAVASNLWANFRVALPAIAACFAIAFVAGLYVREMQDENDPRIVDVGGIGQANQGGEISPKYLELVSNGGNGTGSGERIKTPVMSHTNFDPVSFAQNVNDLKPKLQQVVNQSGLHANEKTHMVPVEDRSGNRMIVPLTEIKLSSSKFEDFQ